MNGLKEKEKVYESNTVEIQKLLEYYEQFYNAQINSERVYPLLLSTSKRHKEKLTILNKADATYHIACVSLKAGHIRRSLEYFATFKCLCALL